MFPGKAGTAFECSGARQKRVKKSVASKVYTRGGGGKWRVHTKLGKDKGIVLPKKGEPVK